MPKVVVYIPAAQWRAIGEDPEVVRQIVKDALSSSVSERGEKQARPSEPVSPKRLSIMGPPRSVTEPKLPDLTDEVDRHFKPDFKK